MSNSRNIDEGRLARMFAALGNPHRLRIFLRLVDCCKPGTASCCADPDAVSACVGELGEDVNVAPSTLSHHIKELHNAGLIQMERRGQKVACWIDPAVLDDLRGFFK